MGVIVKERYVEKYIEKEREKIWNAYLAVDVKSKTGYEKVPLMLSELLSETSPHFKVKDFFEVNTDKEVYITDDVFNIDNDYYAWELLEAIINKDVIVHIRTNVDMVNRTKNFLEEALRVHTNPIALIIEWKYYDASYLLQVRKRVDFHKVNFLRLYIDGTGVIIHYDTQQYKTYYFSLDANSSSYIIRNIEQKIDRMVANPCYLIVDDREYGFSVSVEYNHKWKYPDLQEEFNYDFKEYSNDEHEIKIIKQLLSFPEISSFWRKCDN